MQSWSSRWFPPRSTPRPSALRSGRLAAYAAALLGATACSGDGVLVPLQGDVVAISASTPAFSKGGNSSGLVTKVTPEAATVMAGEALQLTALDAENNPVSASWSSSNPAVATVSSSGLLSAVAAGEAKIQAKTRNRSATMSVSVRAATVQVATVEVTPASGTIEAGKTIQLSATVRDANGNVLVNHPVAWASSNAAVATVNASGLVTGVASGSVQITASSEGKSGTAAITVASAIYAPSPGAAVNECSAPKTGWIWCDDFEQDRLSSYFEHNAHGGDFVRAAAVGVKGSSAMRARWQTAGQVGAGWMHVAFGRTPSSYMRPVDAGTRNYREIYWRFYLKNQPGWIGGGGHKISRARIFATSDWKQAMQAHVWSSYTDVNYLVVDPVSFTDEQGNLTGTARWLGMKRGTTPVFDADHVGRWYCVEARVRLNDAGQSNGAFELWLDGVPEASRTSLNWVGAYDAFGINTVTLDNYWNDGAPQPQERYFDNLVVSTERIGC